MGLRGTNPLRLTLHDEHGVLERLMLLIFDGGIDIPKRCSHAYHSFPTSSIIAYQCVNDETISEFYNIMVELELERPTQTGHFNQRAWNPM